MHLATLNAMNEIVKLHGVPKAIVSNWDTKFTSNLCKSLFQALSTTLNFSIAYQSQSDVQRKRVNQVIEDVVDVCEGQIVQVGRVPTFGGVYIQQ